MNLLTYFKALVPLGSLVFGLAMIKASYETTTVQASAGPYQSRSVYSQISLPDSARNLLFWGGTILAIGGTGASTLWVVDGISQDRAVGSVNSALNGKNVRRKPLAVQQRQEKYLSQQPTSKKLPASKPATQQTVIQPVEPTVIQPPVVTQPTVIQVPEPKPVVYPSPIEKSVASQRSPLIVPPPDQFDEMRQIILNEPAALIYGPQGSGKTSKHGWALGECIKQGNKIIYVNILGKKKWYEGIRTWGKGKNYREVEYALRELFLKPVSERLRREGEDASYSPFHEPRLVLFADEITGWPANVAPDIRGELVENMSQFLRQANAAVILCGHGRTLDCTVGKDIGEGRADVFKNQIIHVKCYSKVDLSEKGRKVCAGYAEVSRGDEKQRITIPRGMIPPNPNIGENGERWYDFRPLLREYTPWQLEEEIQTISQESDSLLAELRAYKSNPGYKVELPEDEEKPDFWA